MAQRPTVWLRCSCSLLIRAEDTVIKPRSHPTLSADALCHGEGFRIVAEPSEEDLRRARAELQRRETKRKLLAGPKGRAYKQGPGTNPWDGVRSTTARPSKGQAGSPGLGKRS